MHPAEKHLVPIETGRLEAGMYVAELDRSWLHTPFEVRGFLLTQQSQVDILRRCCDYVYIDPNRSEAFAWVVPTDNHAQATEDDRPDPAGRPPLTGCRELLRELRGTIARTIRLARVEGRLAIEPIVAQLDDLIERILQAPDAMQWLLATEPARGHLNRRSLGTAVFAIIFGKHLGFDRGALRDLATGALILDIGKTAVPIAILSKSDRLNPVERAFARRHVDRSVALVRLNARLEHRVVDMVSAHHERLDGSGYPRQIAGTDIPLYARIAAIVDTFDAMTQDRGYAKARSGHAALRYLHTWRAIKFDAALIDEFVHAIGVYPVGTTVELVDGSLGVVCRHDPREPKRPDVLLRRDAGGHAVYPARIANRTPNQRIHRAMPALTLAR